MRTFFSLLWIVFLGITLYVYYFYSDFFQNELKQITESSIYLAYLVLFIIGSIRGFTLIPSTYLIILGLLFFPPLPLYIIIFSGILISSVSVYYFFNFLNIDVLLEKRYSKQIYSIKRALEKNELPIIIGWSAFPFLPTDIICYICGSLKVDIKKFLLGIFIGEGVVSAIYIFFGNYLLDYFGSVLV